MQEQFESNIEAESDESIPKDILKQIPQKCIHLQSQANQPKIEQKSNNEQQSQSEQNKDQFEIRSHTHTHTHTLAEDQDDLISQANNKNLVTINEDSINQILTVYLEPGKSIWLKGEIIASNRSCQVYQRRWGYDIQKLLQVMKFGFYPQPQKLKNNDRDIAYYCIRRKYGGGKILYLREDVYGQVFYVDLKKVILINCELQFDKLEFYEQLPYLTKIQHNSDINIALQSNPGSIIMQKSLGQDESLYIGSLNIIAMSDSISVKRENNQICLKGPGYVFMETYSPAQSSLFDSNSIGKIVLLLFLAAIMISMTFQL